MIKIIVIALAINLFTISASNTSFTTVLQEQDIKVSGESSNTSIMLSESPAPFFELKTEETRYSSEDRLPAPIEIYTKPINPLDRTFGFDPGYLISDTVFLNNNSMSINGIQSFLETIVPECKSSSLPCLKDFTLNIPETLPDKNGICGYIAETPNVSAAYAIKVVADVCGINPQVIITHLEKEQGLISSVSPTSYMYRAAMGYNCADSHNLCGTLDGGFWNQIYEGSKQKLWYGNPESDFTYFKLNTESAIKYHPNPECGTKNVNIKNRATASLYYYTPYVPNEAAMANLQGLGNECSSYGNRNFFRLFNEWFGDSRTAYKFIGKAR